MPDFPKASAKVVTSAQTAKYYGGFFQAETPAKIGKYFRFCKENAVKHTFNATETRPLRHRIFSGGTEQDARTAPHGGEQFPCAHRTGPQHGGRKAAAGHSRHGTAHARTAPRDTAVAATRGCRHPAAPARMAPRDARACAQTPEALRKDRHTLAQGRPRLCA